VSVANRRENEPNTARRPARKPGRRGNHVTIGQIARLARDKPSSWLGRCGENPTSIRRTSPVCRDWQDVPGVFDVTEAKRKTEAAPSTLPGQQSCHATRPPCGETSISGEADGMRAIGGATSCVSAESVGYFRRQTLRGLWMSNQTVKAGTRGSAWCPGTATTWGRYHSRLTTPSEPRVLSCAHASDGRIQPKG